MVRAVLTSLLLAGGAARAAKAPALPTCIQSSKPHLCLAPPELRRAYEVNPLLDQRVTGRHRTIAIVDSFGSPTIRTDLHAFDRAFGLPDPDLVIRAPLGVRHPRHTGWEFETTLDVEWAHVMAPGARILLLTSPADETEGTVGLPQFLTLERYALSQHADVISQSWAVTEATLRGKAGQAMVAKFHDFYAEAARRGVTVVSGSGDSGTAGLDQSLKHYFRFRVAQWPASDPYVLAVGGTRLFVKGGLREVAWRGSGGGFSSFYPEPSYQRCLSRADQRLLGNHRGYPDVALNAGNRVVIYDRGRWDLIGGTSAAAPQWAGLIALADEEAGHDLGDIHPALYHLACSPRYHSDLRDITSGSIVDPPHSHYPNELHAGPSWDPATGLGTPLAAQLLADIIQRESHPQYAHLPVRARRAGDPIRGAQ